MGRSSSMTMIIVHIVCALVLCFCDSASSQFDGAAPPQPVTGVRFFSGLLNLPIPSYGMISQNAFCEDDYGIDFVSANDVGENDGQNDGLWCQSASSDSNIGTWIQPNGDTVQDVVGWDTAFPVYMVHTQGQVGLFRPHAINASSANNTIEGLFQCMIPNENGDSQTLVLWIGAVHTFTNINAASLSQDLEFVPPSQPRDSDPPEYSLTFIVNDIPPTYVTCLKDDSVMSDADISREVIDVHYTGNGDSTSVRVILSLKTRDAADYKCNVTFYKLQGAISATVISSEDTVPALTTALISISVTDMPTGLTAIKTEYNIVQLFWSAPASNTPPVAGYEVFYAVSGNGSTQSGGTTTATNAVLSIGLKLGNTYDFFVVAYSDAINALPSAHSNTEMLELVFPVFSGPLSTASTMDSITLSWPMPEYYPTGYTLTSACSLLCNSVEFNPTVTNPSPSDLTAIISGLPPGSECNFTLSASYGDNINHQLNAMMTTMSNVPQAPPTGLTIASVGTTFLYITWDPLDCDQQNGPITAYSIEYIADDTILTTNTDTFPHNLTGLDPCTNYSLRVAAVNEAGRGNFSESVSEITNATTYPVSITSTTVSTTVTSVMLSWTTSSLDNMLFDVSYTLNGATSVITTNQAVFELTDLSPDTSVQITIQPMTVCGPADTATTLIVSTDVVCESSSSQSTTIAVGIGLSVLLFISVWIIIALVIVVWRTRKASPAKTINVNELRNTGSHNYSKSEWDDPEWWCH